MHSSCKIFCSEFSECTLIIKACSLKSIIIFASALVGSQSTILSARLLENHPEVEREVLVCSSLNWHHGNIKECSVGEGLLE